MDTGPNANDEPTAEEVEAWEMSQMFTQYSEAFSKLSQERHEAGAAEYGQFTFLENDVIRMMAEELADTANYCRMQFIKLMLLNNILVDQLESSPGLKAQAENIGMGLQAFKGTKDTGWGKPE